MNATAYHIKRRDELMHAAKVLKHCRNPSPGTVAIMQDCVRLARVHNITARMFRKQAQEV